MTSEALTQLARLYQLIESHLRKHELTLHDLRQMGDIKATEKTNFQVRDLIYRLHEKGYLEKHGAEAPFKYKWKADAPPFTVTHQMQKAATRKPGKVVSTKIAEEDMPKPKAPKPPKALELVFGGVLITISTNAATGNLRINIEQEV